MKKTLLQKLEDRREGVLLSLIDSDDSYFKLLCQFKLTEIDRAILAIKREQQKDKENGK